MLRGFPWGIFFAANTIQFVRASHKSMSGVEISITTFPQIRVLSSPASDKMKKSYILCFHSFVAGFKRL
jgi:hypothetical protein